MQENIEESSKHYTQNIEKNQPMLNNKIKADLAQMFWEPAIDYANSVEAITFETDAEIQAQQERWDAVHKAYTNGVQDVIEFISSNYKLEAKVQTEYCQCEVPDRDSGYTYCKKCNNYISDARMRFLVKPSEKFEIPAKEEDPEILRRKLWKQYDDIDFNNLCARATLYPGKSIEEVKLIQMREKIERVYKEINEAILNSMLLNEPKTRKWVCEILRQEFGNLTMVKCDDENNPPDVVDQQLLIAKIIWNTDYSKEYGYKHVEMIFGAPEQVEKYQRQQYFDNESYNFIQKGI